jgi:aerobic-type carbon monoxide dehydrogenase small subunit (CoxS/CutS family)
MLKSRDDAIALTVNGEAVSIAMPPVTRLADALRDGLGLTGTKIGCNAGDCGACTVLLDGRQVCSCLTALGQVEGREVVTVEGLAAKGKLSDLQAAFQNHGAAQCGICTPGMLIAAADLLARNPDQDAAQVRDALGGVLCPARYQKIVEVVLAAKCKSRADCGRGAPGGWHVTHWRRALRRRCNPRGRALLRHPLAAPPRGAASATSAWRRGQPGIERLLTAADVPERFRHLPAQDQLAFAG